MTTDDHYDRHPDTLDGPAARAPGEAQAPGASTRSPQWGEAYLLFDGQYRSLDDLLGQTGE
ncbi:MAG TPA: hypothetical protein VII06_32710 [Chloroflexota bacterium]|jgi:hypothetical protein